MRAGMRIPISLFVLAAGTVCAQPGRYELGPTHGSRFALTVEKTGLLSGKKHVFEFQRFSGRVLFDRAAPSRSQVELTIDAASAICKDTWVSDKDRSRILAFMLRDMLDVERHPRLTFKSSSIVMKGDRSFEVAGNLDVRGIDKPAKVSVIIDDGEGALQSVNGEALVRLTEYGLKPPKAALGAIGTKDEMTVEFQLVPLPVQESSSAGAQ
jgi:polyisoprenoid-binding protein YceI